MYTLTRWVDANQRSLARRGLAIGVLMAAVVLAHEPQPVQLGVALMCALDMALFVRHGAVRFVPVQEIKRMQSAQAVESLLPTLRSPADGLRYAAAWNAAHTAGEQAVPQLIRLLGDPDLEVRRAAVWALGEIESPQATEPLLRVLRADQAPVRYAAIWALAQIGDRRAAPRLLVLLGAADPQVRQAATAALGWIGDPRARPCLLAALRDPDARVRWAAFWAFERLNSARYGWGSSERASRNGRNPSWLANSTTSVLPPGAT